MDDSHDKGQLSSKPEEDPPVSVPQPTSDVYFSRNEAIIHDLLVDQVRYHTFPAFCYKETMGQAIWMRRTLINWLREVCEHRETVPEVLAHAVQLIDRFVTHVKTDKRDYQLVGAACYLISSKIKDTVPVSVEDIVRYTDFSITKNDLQAKELLIALTLQFDLNMISPVDFIQPLVSFIPCEHDLQQLIRKSANNIFMKIVHVETVNWHLPSYIATACIIYAMNLTVDPDQSDLTQSTIRLFQEILHLESAKLDETYTFFKSLFKPGTIQLSDAVTIVDNGNGTQSPDYQNIVDYLQLPVETSTPTGQLSSSSFHSATSSSSAGLSVTQSSVTTNIGPSTTSVSPLYFVGDNLAADLYANSLNTLATITSESDAFVTDRDPSLLQHSSSNL